MDLIFIVSVLFSFFIGIFLGKILFANKSSVANELKKTKEELDVLKIKLKHHFSENVLLFKQFDDSYQKLFKKFGESIEDLSDSVTTQIPPKDREYLDRKEVLEEDESSKKSDEVVQPKDY